MLLLALVLLLWFLLFSMGLFNDIPTPPVHSKLREALEATEKLIILEGLEQHRWNKNSLAKELGISRASLINKINRYNLGKGEVK